MVCAQARPSPAGIVMSYTDNGTKLGLASVRENSPFSVRDQDYYDVFLQSMQRRLKKLDQGDTRGKENMCEFQNILNRKLSDR